MTHDRCRLRAFSLAELVMVVIILGLLAAIAAPRVANTIRHQRLDAASRRLMIDLELTRSQAIRDRTNRSLTLSLTDHSYTLPTQVGMGSSSQVCFNTPPYNEVVMAGSTFSTDEVKFNRLGLPDEAGSITLRAGNEQVVISLNAATGQPTRTFGP